MSESAKTVLITGAAKRVGKAIALALAEAGCDVAIHFHRSAEAAEKTVTEIRRLGREAVTIQGDLSREADCERIVSEAAETLGRLDVLVNNASRFDPTPLEEADGDAWQRMLSVNLVAPGLLARAAVPHLRASGSGQIINLVDVLADRPPKRFHAYSASKAGLVSLTKSLARELAPEIRVNGIAPGIATFPPEYDEETRERLIDKVPLKREGSPEQIATVTRFLVMEADYITGEIIRVDGGWSIAN